MLPERQDLVARLFPNGMPKLLCPPLTHFDGPMRMDRGRMAAHYRTMAPLVGVFLVPGSTGDGWLMDDAMMLDALALSGGFAVQYGGGILAAVLKPELNDMLLGIEKVRDAVAAKTGRRDAQGFVEAGLKGITVCAPAGTDRTQAEIEGALRAVLDVDLPTALYQLPQITKNEISPEVFARLAADYPNFYLFKDTSGNDRVALSRVETKGVFLVRGMEGGYARWYKANGGPYDGFLLSTANGFAPELARILALSDAGDKAGAQALSDRLDALIAALLDLVAPVPCSNIFANSARIVDHLRAYGDAWASSPAPCLPDGSRLDADLLARGIGLIQAAGFPSAHGYLI
ncbi:MAG TPA: dihydrodipicolinate synthase family protein [Clostridia bacterium]|nr:dihydrodipicolinate synthase family protein [Clostridia bacterium]